MISSKEISQFSLPDEILYLLLQIKTLVCVMSMIFVEAAIFVPIALVGISFHFFQPLQERIILRDDNFYPIRGYPVPLDPNGPGFTRSD